MLLTWRVLGSLAADPSRCAHISQMLQCSRCKADDMAVSLQVDDAAHAANMPKFSSVTATDLTGSFHKELDALQQLLQG